MRDSGVDERMMNSSYLRLFQRTMAKQERALSPRPVAWLRPPVAIAATRIEASSITIRRR